MGMEKGLFVHRPRRLWRMAGAVEFKDSVHLEKRTITNSKVEKHSHFGSSHHVSSFLSSLSLSSVHGGLWYSRSFRDVLMDATAARLEQVRAILVDLGGSVGANRVHNPVPMDVGAAKSLHRTGPCREVGSHHPPVSGRTMRRFQHCSRHYGTHSGKRKSSWRSASPSSGRKPRCMHQTPSWSTQKQN